MLIYMKPLTTVARLLLAILILAAIGCGEPLDPGGRDWNDPDLCAAGPQTGIVVCQSTLDLCISAHDHDCYIGPVAVLGDLTLTGDGVSSTYTIQQGSTTLTGTWSRVDRTIDLHPDDGGPDITIDLVESGAGR